jgi:hypothetical protein
MSKPFHNTLLILSLCVAVPSLAFPYFERQRENERSFGCQQNLKQISLAMDQYSKILKAKFPVARIGWANAIQPNLKTQSLGCASDTALPNISSPQFKFRILQRAIGSTAIYSECRKQLYLLLILLCY